MTTITKERIELFIKNPLDNGLTRGEQMELAQIALASLAAEPMAWKWRLTSLLTVCRLARGGCVLRHYHPARGMGARQKLFHFTPPRQCQ